MPDPLVHPTRSIKAFKSPECLQQPIGLPKDCSYRRRPAPETHRKSVFNDALKLNSTDVEPSGALDMVLSIHHFVAHINCSACYMKPHGQLDAKPHSLAIPH